VSPISKNKV